MRLEPGAIRELHWHALAAEWAYVISGRCRTRSSLLTARPKWTTSRKATRGTSRAGTVMPFRRSVPASATFCSGSTTGTSPNSAPSALPIGSRVRLATFSRATSIFRNPPLANFRRKSCTSVRDAFRRLSKTCGIRSCNPASPHTSFVLARWHPRYWRAVKSGSSLPTNFPSRPRSPRFAWT